jgi:hypothetical protein
VTKQDPDYWKNARKIYQIKDENNNQVVGGYYRSSTKTSLTLLTLPKAGHMVPTTYLQATKQFLQDYITS